MFKRLNKGQSTAEYAVVIGLVIAAAVAMQVYVKRGIQSKIKNAMDFTVYNATLNVNIGAGQYEPYYLSQELTTTREGTSVSSFETGGKTTRSIDGQEVTSRTGCITTASANEYVPGS